MPYDYDPQLKKCTVRGAPIFPTEIFTIADQIEILDMSGCHLSALPDNFGDLVNLRIAFFAHNDFTEIPAVLANCTKLEMVGFKSCKISTFGDNRLPAGIRGIILTDNQLTELPTSIGQYTQLQKIMLAGNQLQSLPRELLLCQNLELIRVAVNQLPEEPDWLFQLPKLGWYSDASNSYSYNTHLPVLTEYSWRDITLGEQIGKSAHNTVFKGTLPDGTAVAVKLFSNSLITDGTPEDDMATSLLAGTHANVIGSLGKLINAPDNQAGLIMPLISSRFTTLGLPPDLRTLTRDTYPADTIFSAAFIIQVAHDVAAALGHLSSRGIMHGDIYAHNILSDARGESYLGDFGAASTYKPDSANLRQKVDVLGFGYLLEDLLNHAVTAADPTLQKVHDAKAVCLAPKYADRPTFFELTL
jgi:serine/threonine protein kinase